MVISLPMDESRFRCFLLAHQGPHDDEAEIEEHLAELEELANSIRVKGRLIIRESCGAQQDPKPPERYVSHTNPPEPMVRRWRGKSTKEQ